MGADLFHVCRTALAAVFMATASCIAVSGAAMAQDTVTSVTTLGLEQYDSTEAALTAIFARQDRLESALRVFQTKLVELTEVTNTTAARLARGDEPLVSLEIEQLWSMVRTLESDNANLRAEIEQLRTAAGE